MVLINCLLKSVIWLHFVQNSDNTNKLVNLSNSHLSFPFVLVTKIDKTFISS